MTLSELEQTIVELEEEMLAAAEELRFEYAARVRDEIRDLRRELTTAQANEAPAGLSHDALHAAPCWPGTTRDGRDLPWRRTRDPYAILVSEVMAQQTQVARVLARYERWLERWPTPAALAAAAPAEVLTRVGRPGLQPARAAPARGVRDRRARRLAARRRGLRALPGVGPYTAAAVASFAFGERGRRGRHERAAGRRAAGRRPAARCCRPTRHADWNQAAMELGARVCTRARAALRRVPGRRRGARRAGAS